MTDDSSTADRTARRLRRIARGLGSLVAAFWLFMSAAHAIGGRDPWTWESTIMAVLIVTSILGVLVAWFREGLGGAILLTVGVAHSTFALFAAGHNRGLAMLISGGPFLLIGVLFLASWWRAGRTGRRQGRAQGTGDGE